MRGEREGVGEERGRGGRGEREGEGERELQRYRCVERQARLPRYNTVTSKPNPDKQKHDKST